MISFQTRQENLVYDQKVLVVSIQGQIDNRSVRQFEKQMQDYYNIGYRFLILDCENLGSVGSEGLETLLHMVETFQKAGGIFLMIHAPGQISRYFDLQGFSPIFTSFTTDQEAIQYLIDQLQQAYAGAGYGEGEKGVPSTQTSEEKGGQGQHPTVAYPQQQQTRPQGGGVTTARYQQGKEPLPPLDIELQYFQKMKTFDIFPLTIVVAPTDKCRGNPMLHIAPVLPGCLTIPLNCTVPIKERVEVKFWVTPLVPKKMDATIAFSKGEKFSHVPLKCRGTRQRASIYLLVLAVIAPVLLKWNPPAIAGFIAVLLKTPIPLFIKDYLGMVVGLIFLSTALLVFLLHRPRKAKPLSLKLYLSES